MRIRLAERDLRYGVPQSSEANQQQFTGWKRDLGEGKNRATVRIISRIVRFRPIALAAAAENSMNFFGNTAFMVWKLPCIHQT